jgi:hypothetical protein
MFKVGFRRTCPASAQRYNEAGDTAAGFTIGAMLKLAKKPPGS